MTDAPVVAVTGAARGIGRACAEGFLAEGWRVVGVDRSWHGSAGNLERFAGRPDAIITDTLDIRDGEAVDAACRRTLRIFGRVDALINNVAMRQRDLFPPGGITTVLETEDDDWKQMFSVNVLGTLTVIRHFARPMIAAGRGSVINVGTRGSVTNAVAQGVWRGRHPGFRNQPYDATKAAMCSMSFYLAEELRQHNVAINVLFPGATKTEGSEDIAAARRALGIQAPPLLRPGHVVPLALHLAGQRPDDGGDTGLAIDSLQWNASHGHGDVQAWRAL